MTDQINDDPQFPRLIVIAGPNGSGKSTLTDKLRANPAFEFPANYVNPDEIAKTLTIDDPQKRADTARELADRQRDEWLKNREPFAFETVMSHPSKLADMIQAKRADYDLTLVFVATADPRLNVQRVADRVADGGHDVPTDRVIARYERTMIYLPKAAEIADRALVFDNSGRQQNLIAMVQDKTPTIVHSSTPAWVNDRLIVPLAERQRSQEQIDQHAQARGLIVKPADELAGKYVGPILMVTDHHAIQQTGANVAIRHDRVMLAVDVQQGQKLNVSYSQGVSVAQGLGQSRDRGQGKER